MTITSKSIKKTAAGLMVAALAVGFSAFTEHVNFADTYIVNKGSSNFSHRDNMNPLNCLETEPTPCSYKILSPDDVPIQEEYSSADLEFYESKGWIEPSQGEGVYSQ